MEITSYDEKHVAQSNDTPSNSPVDHQIGTTTPLDPALIPRLTSKLQRLANRLETIAGIKARGIERFSANCTANNMTVGILGPIAYGLGFVDTMICCLFGTILGSCLTAYISTFGPMSGNRTLVLAILFVFACLNPHPQLLQLKDADSGTLIQIRSSQGLGWPTAATDFYIYLPQKASRLAVFCMISSGLILGKLFVEIVGIGLGSGVSLNPTWAAADKISTGALIVEALSPLGAFGSFCAVLLALGVVRTIFLALILLLCLSNYWELGLSKFRG
ncbi:hypothetical protein BDZ45DRAFT_753601 [Acephala macrosclerotiorum]|nr:hypothetical protein BDZ45DRAFT_753601 [Acephala macrosclerotiorum]